VAVGQVQEKEDGCDEVVSSVFFITRLDIIPIASIARDLTKSVAAYPRTLLCSCGSLQSPEKCKPPTCTRHSDRTQFHRHLQPDLPYLLTYCDSMR
jgi:hypothetical protein